MLGADIDPWITPAGIVLAALTVGALVEWLMRSRLRAWALKTTWRGDDLVVATVRGVPLLASALIGVRIAATTAPLADRARVVVENTVDVGAIMLATVMVMRVAAQVIASQA